MNKKQYQRPCADVLEQTFEDIIVASGGKIEVDQEKALGDGIVLPDNEI